MSPKNKKKQRFIETHGSEGRIRRGVELLETGSLIRFNFKYYSFGENSGQSFEDWQSDAILADMNDKLHSLSGCSIRELQQNDRLSFYEQFPEDSAFEEPAAFRGLNVKWAKLRITGRRRIIGVMMPNVPGAEDVFYVVFLDKNHQFYPMEKD